MKTRWSSSQYKSLISKKISETKKSLLENPFYKKEFITRMQIIGKLPWLSEDFRVKKSNEMIKRWEDPLYREKVIERVIKNNDIFWHSPKFEEARIKLCQGRSERYKILWKDPEYRKNMMKILSEAFQDSRSNLEKEHEQIFFDYGFLNSEVFEDYIVDYCDKFHKIIVEVYGDFWHCNPNQWKAEDINPVIRKSAKDIWEKDQRKIDFLKTKGYKVYTLWETDLKKKNFSIEKFLAETLNLTSNVKDEFRGLTREKILENLNISKTKLSVLFENWLGDYNFGTGLRNSNAFNLEKVFFLSNKKKWDKRSAVGSHLYCNLRHLPTLEDLLLLKKEYVFIGVDCVPGSIPMETFEWPKNTLMIFGEEGRGISSETLALCDKIVHITQYGSVRSLNVGTASGIAMYDYVRKFEVSK